MHWVGKTILAVGLSLACQSGWAQITADSPQVRNWAWDQVKSWQYTKKDPQGHRLWKPLKFFDLTYEEQTNQLLDRLTAGTPLERRAALMVLGDRPLDQWGPRGLRRTECRDEVGLWLYRHGFKYTDREPLLYLEPSARLDRPWTQGLGLHLEGQSWCFQWIPSPVLLPKGPGLSDLPRALAAAPIPSVLLHFKHLRPGLERLEALAGGSEGLVSTLASGTRMGFLARHLGPWLHKPLPGLEALAEREAWVLQYGQPRGFGPASGTLAFLPGEFPTRANLVINLLRLNPTDTGPRTQVFIWTDPRGGRAQVTQVRNAGGVVHILAVPDGTWISDREEPLRAIAFPSPFPTLGERSEWCKAALAAMGQETEVSLWLLPRMGAGASFERTALRRRLLGLDQPTWPNPFIAKAAPRMGILSASLGAGPTQVILGAILRRDQEGIPGLPALPSGPIAPNPAQVGAYNATSVALADRKSARNGLADEIQGLQNLLDLRGAAILWKGWISPPELSSQQKEAMAEFQKLQREDPVKAARMAQNRQVKIFGGFLEPGMCPSIALALPIRDGMATQAEERVKKVWPRLFTGRFQTQEYAKGVMIRRVATDQAFHPAFAIAGNTLILGTHEEAVQDMAAGVLGQIPTLADLPSQAYGRLEVDGALAAKDLDTLLLAYLRSNQTWWPGQPEPTGDEAAAEVASTFGPFLGALRGLGRKGLDVRLSPAGFLARPR